LILRPLRNVVLSRESKDCGVAALATVLRHHGRRIGVERLKMLVPTDQQGTTLGALCRAAHLLGLDASAGRAARTKLPELPLPAIVHMRGRTSLDHFVVLLSVGKDSVLLADPESGIRREELSTFLDTWLGGILLLRPGAGWHNAASPKGETANLLTKAIAPHTRYLLLSVALAFLGSVAGIIGSLRVGTLFNVLSGRSLGAALIVIAQIGLFSLGRIACTNLSGWFSLQYGRRLESALGGLYLKSLLHWRLEFFDTHSPSDVMARLTDVTRMRAVFNSTLIGLIVDLSMLILATLWILHTSFRMGLLFVSAVIATAILAAYMSDHLVILYRSIVRTSANFQQRFFETITNMRAIKTLNAETFECKRLLSSFDESLGETTKAGATVLRLTAALQCTTCVTSLMSIYIATVGVWKGDLSLGTLVSIYAIGGILLSSIERAAPALANLKEAQSSAVSLSEVLTQNSDLMDLQAVSPSTNEVASSLYVRDLRYAYPNASTVLDSCSFHIPGASTVSIIGSSGCGKSTLARILAGLQLPTEGSVEIEHEKQPSATTANLRASVCLVFQESGLMSGSIRENITLGSPDSADEEVVWAAKLANAHGFIVEKERGYDTEIGPGGSLVSSGQRQRIAIARALLRRAPILILDEATSALDPETELSLIENLLDARRGFTTIFVTHRLATALTAQRWLVLDAGRIVEDGTPQVLLNGRSHASTLFAVDNRSRNDEPEMLEIAR
jgi:ATP-binding cassette subfamily B protein